MKAITLWQPWASLVAIGAKSIETRSWAPGYRGPLAIHAGQAWDGTLVRLCKSEPFAEVLEAAGLCERGPRGGWRTSLPFGAVVAVCRVADCLPTEEVFGVYGETRHERAFGDYTPGRWAWVLSDLRQLPEPLPARGRQQLWEWDAPAEVLALVQGR